MNLECFEKQNRSPFSSENFQQYLQRLGLLDKGFAYRELVSRNPLSRRKRVPPKEMWPDFSLMLAAAIEFRKFAMRKAKVRGLRVAAAYRPLGGASRSAHKHGRALDLDRIGGNAESYYVAAVSFWAKNALVLQGGLGLYPGRPDHRGGLRVHMDVEHGIRSWQHTQGKSMRPWVVGGRRVSLAYKLADELGLDPSKPEI